MDAQKWVFGFGILALAIGLSIVPSRMASQTPVRAPSITIWLGGEDPVVQQQKHKSDPADYMDMFKPDASWSTAASGLTAFKISTQFALHATDEQLRSVIDDLHRRNIGLAIELGLLVGTDRCGKGVEGYGSPAGVEAVAKRVKSHGGQIDYIAMDEPVWYGHIFTSGSAGRVGCQSSLSDLAEQVAQKSAILLQYFPNIQIGDIEPINSRSPQSIDDLTKFVDLLKQKTGMKLAFVHADIAWKTNFQPLLEQLANRLHARGIRFGVICDGDADVGGDRAWVNQALQRCKAIAANPKTRPDTFIVQSWEPLPKKMLPETDPGALTYEAKQVIAMFH
jgi:hypothetical protein